MVARIKHKILYPFSIKPIFDALKSSDKRCYLVGGCVRDAIMGRDPKDYDIATDATPDEVISCLRAVLDEHYSFDEVGKAFGIVNVNFKMGSEKQQFEIATFRTDVGEGRRPDSVEFATIEQDVMRRDLTINALFYDIDNEEIIDYVGGIHDIKTSTIKTVGNPIDRFREDPLRKLRAIRFASRFDFRLDGNTYACIKNDPRLTGVSSERIRDELAKAHSTTARKGVLSSLLATTGMHEECFPGLKFDCSSQGGSWIVWLASLLKENDPELVQDTLRLMKYTNEECQKVSLLLRLLTLRVSNAYQLKKLYERLRMSEHEVRTFFKIVRPAVDDVIDAFLNWQLCVTGDELIAQGFEGKAIGEEMKRIETAGFRSALLSARWLISQRLELIDSANDID